MSAKLSGYVAVIFAAAGWGTSGIFVKAILLGSEISPLALAFWRDLCTAILLFAGLFVLRRDRLRVAPRDLVRLAATGAGLGAFHTFWNLGVFLNGAAVATIQQSAMPAMVVIAAWFLWREPLTWRKIVAVLLTFAGTAFVSGVDALGQVSLTTNGLLVGVCLPLAYAAWNLFGKSVRAQYDAITVLAYAFAFGALALLPFQFFVPFPLPVPATSYFWFAGMLAQTIIAFSLYTFGLGHLPASVASILAMTEIVFVTIYAYTLLGERLVLLQVLGAAFVIIGVLLLVEWRAPVAQDA
ncbi:MAG: DMT family transporter [Chloroflexi bacterium]|nr:DMT family transporter [Chloroflexota bacterium]